ncbi:hypothetical protein KDRO_F00100 [Kluyveromyces lactis]|nr:hypothetical protein KDRO_F00100 [Kluyveromyces lactis]
MKESNTITVTTIIINMLQTTKIAKKRYNTFRLSRLLRTLGLTPRTQITRITRNPARDLMIDSGATISVVHDKSLLHNFNPSSDQQLFDAQENQIRVEGEGNLILKFKKDKIKVRAILATDMSTNVISDAHLKSAGIFRDNRQPFLISRRGKRIAQLYELGSLCWIPYCHISKPHEQTISAISIRDAPNRFSLANVHRWFGHINVKYIRESIRKGHIQGLKENDVDWTGYSSFQCQQCLESKAKRNNHYVNSRMDYTKEYYPFEYLHTDLFGPIRCRSSYPPQYFIAFTDEITRFRWTYPLYSKTAEEVVEKFKEIVMQLKSQFGTRVRTIQMDRGSEFTNNMTRAYLKERGILIRYTTTADSKAHGVAERQHYTMLNDCRTHLQHANLPPKLWYHAIVFSNTVRNTFVNRHTGTSPRNKASMAGLSFKDVLPFGQPVITHIHDPQSKLDSRGILGYALHPSTESYGYIIYVPEENKIIDTRNYVILKHPPGENISQDEIEQMIERIENEDTANIENVEPNEEPHYAGSTQPMPYNTDYIADNINENFETITQEMADFGLEYGGDTLSPVTPSDAEDSFTPSDAGDPFTPAPPEPISENRDPISPPDSNQDGMNGGINDSINDGINESPEPYRANSNASSAQHEEEQHASPTNLDFSPIIDGLETNTTIQEEPLLPPITDGLDTNTIIQEETLLPTQQPDTTNPNPSDDDDTINDKLKSIPIFNGNKYKGPRTTANSFEPSYGGGTYTENYNHPTLEEVFESIERDPFNLTSQKRPRSSNTYRESDQDSYDSGGDFDEEQEQEYSSDNTPTRPQNKRIRRVNYVHAIEHTKGIMQMNTSINYSEAISRNRNEKEKSAFQDAYKKEIAQLTKMHTWSEEFIDASLIPKQRIINSMFIFTTKRDNSKKCRLVARGDQQSLETYDPEQKATTVHHLALMTVLAMALDHNLTAVQLDISSAYLYADLKEELYIRAPPHMNARNKVLKLNKSLYGLKQSGANWCALIKQFLIEECGLIEDRFWKCVFTAKESLKLVVCLFVDDMLVVGRSDKHIVEFISKLSKRFDTKVVNDGKHREEDGVNEYDILGVELEYKKGEYMKFGMQKSLEDKLPHLGVPLFSHPRQRKVPGCPGDYISSGEDLTLDDQDYKDKVKHLQKLVGLASYVGHKFRFEILYYVNILAQHQLYPSAKVLDRAAQLCQYLWDTRDKKLIWKYSGPNNNEITAISDAAFAGNNDFKSQSGALYLWNGKAIAAKSSKIKLTCVSSTEAEIYSISNCVTYLRGIEILVDKLLNTKSIIKLKTDSQPAMAIIKRKEDAEFLKKHTGSRAMRIRDECNELGLVLEYIPTKENTADILTKPLSMKLFKLLTEDWIQ